MVPNKKVAVAFLPHKDLSPQKLHHTSPAQRSVCCFVGREMSLIKNIMIFKQGDYKFYIADHVVPAQTQRYFMLMLQIK